MATIRGRFDRLVCRPLSGRGLLLIGGIEGLVGWPLSHLALTTPASLPAGLGPLTAIVGLWTVLTAIIVAVAVRYSTPTVVRERAWVLWAAVNTVATAVNLVVVAGAEGLVSLPTTAYLYGYWQPWALAFAVGYLGTAWFGRADPRVPVVSRLAYVLAGLASVAYLLASLTTPFPGARDVVLVLGALHVGPIAVAVCDTGTR